MCAFAINTKTAPKLGDNKGNDFLVGTFRYEVKTVSYEVNKQNPSGTEKQVVVDFTREGKSYRAWYPCESADDNRAQMAVKGLTSLACACDFKGVLKPESLKKLEGNAVDIEAKVNTKNGKSYVNIVDITAPEADEEEEQEEEPSVVVEAEEPEEEEEAAAGKKAKPWG